MNGMLPPVPWVSAGRPNVSCEADCSACSNHGASGGACQPASEESTSKRTRAAYGGSASSASLTRAAAAVASSVGGRRIDSLSATRGKSTLPALPSGGSPSAPVTVSVGFQVELISSSVGSLLSGRTPAMNGSLPATVAPRTAAAWRASVSRPGGVATCRPSSTMSPLCTFSIRSSRPRRILNGDTAIPVAIPEWTPSVSTSTDSVPVRLPRSELVSHSCS